MKGKVIILIDPEGNPTVSVEGAKGKVCTAMTAPYEDALGTTTKSTKKPEYHQQAETISERATNLARG